MILRDAKAIKLGTTTINKIYSGTYKVYDKNKTVLEGYCIQNGEPTPDNPIEIETMKGRQIIPIKKINIISTDVNDWEGGQYNQTNGAKSNDGHRIRMKELVPVEPGNVYYVNTFTKEYNIILRTYDENKTFISSIGNVTNGTTITITTSKYISVSLWKYGNSSISYTELLQKISDKEIIPYICLDSAKYVVDLKSKNLIDKNNPMYVNKPLQSDGVVSGSSTTSNVSQYIRVNENTNYVLSLNNDSNARRIAFYSEPLDTEVTDSRVLSVIQYIGNEKTFTTPQNCKYIRFSYYKESENIQLEQGSTPTTYELFYDYELAGIDTYKDTIFTREGKWYKGNKINRMVLDGSEEGWILAQTNTNTYRFTNSTVLSNKKAISINKNLFLCNEYQKYAGNRAIGAVDEEGIAIRDTFTGFTIRALISRVTDLNGFKAWLSTHNTIVYYVLETPTEEQITAPGLITQLNALYQAM